MSFSEFAKNTQLASDSWNKQKIISTADRSFGGVVKIWRMLHKVCELARKRMEDAIKDNAETYAPNVATERNLAQRTEYADFLNANKKKYCDLVNEIADSKISEVTKTVSKTGDPDLISLIQGLTLRSDIGDKEWQSIVQRVNESHDYQASALLADVATTKFNRTYKKPFDADKVIDEIEISRKELLHMASVLGKPESEWTLTEMSTVGEYSTPTVQQMRFAKLDSAPGAATPNADTKLSLIDRLKEAQEIARNNGDNATANRINRFIYERGEWIEDRQVIAGFYKEEAEALIKAVFDAC